MDALVEAALAKVNEETKKIDGTTPHTRDHRQQIVKAVNAVDALKSALKTV